MGIRSCRRSQVRFELAVKEAQNACDAAWRLVAIAYEYDRGSAWSTWARRATAAGVAVAAALAFILLTGKPEEARERPRQLASLAVGGVAVASQVELREELHEKLRYFKKQSDNAKINRERNMEDIKTIKGVFDKVAMGQCDAIRPSAEQPEQA